MDMLQLGAATECVHNEMKKRAYQALRTCSSNIKFAEMLEGLAE